MTDASEYDRAEKDMGVTVDTRNADAKNEPDAHSHDGIFHMAALFCGALILVALGAVVLFLLLRAWPIFAGPRSQTEAVFTSLSGGKAHGFLQYVGPLIFGTVVMPPSHWLSHSSSPSGWRFSLISMHPDASVPYSITSWICWQRFHRLFMVSGVR